MHMIWKYPLTISQKNHVYLIGKLFVIAKWEVLRNKFFFYTNLFFIIFEGDSIADLFYDPQQSNLILKGKLIKEGHDLLPVRMHCGFCSKVSKIIKLRIYGVNFSLLPGFILECSMVSKSKSNLMEDCINLWWEFIQNMISITIYTFKFIKVEKFKLFYRRIFIKKSENGLN